VYLCGCVIERRDETAGVFVVQRAGGVERQEHPGVETGAEEVPSGPREAGRAGHHRFLPLLHLALPVCRRGGRRRVVPVLLVILVVGGRGPRGAREVKDGVVAQAAARLVGALAGEQGGQGAEGSDARIQRAVRGRRQACSVGQLRQ